MGGPGNLIVKRTHSLFVDDLEVCQESNNVLKNVNEIIVQVSYDTGPCFGVPKCAEFIFEHGKIVRAEDLQVLETKMKTMEPDENKIFKFMGIEQADRFRTKTVFEKVKEGVSKRVKMIANTKLGDANLIKVINMKVMAVAAYATNICRLNVGELKKLDQTIRREHQEKNTLEK